MKRVFFMLFIFVSVFAMAQTEEDENRGYIVKVGDMAPDFELKVDDGTTMRLSDLRDKVVMLQFTASWCGICRKEMPFIERDIWQKYKGNPDFVLYGVDLKETKDKVVKLKEFTKVTYPIAYDKNGKAFALYALASAGVTRNVLIDREGRIIMLTRKYTVEEFDSLCKRIAEEL